MTSVARSKPKANEWRVEFVRGSGWFVVSPDTGYSAQAFDNRNSALTSLGRAKSAAAKTARCRERACMTCGQKFLSEGFHNRLCRSCRHRGQDLDPVRPYIARRG